MGLVTQSPMHSSLLLLLATSAMNGAIDDSTCNVFFKMHFGKVYNGMLSTSMGTLDVALGEIGSGIA